MPTRYLLWTVVGTTAAYNLNVKGNVNAWDFRHGTGRWTPVALGGPDAWQSPDQAEMQGYYRTPMNQQVHATHITTPADDFKHGVGRKMPVSMGGPNGWDSDYGQAYNDYDPVLATRMASPSDEFKHGVGRKMPVPLGGPNAW